MWKPEHKDIEPLITVYLVRSKGMLYSETNNVMCTVATQKDADEVVAGFSRAFPDVDEDYFWVEKQSVWPEGLAVPNLEELFEPRPPRTKEGLEAQHKEVLKMIAELG